jgi:hypothetical protein
VLCPTITGPALAPLSLEMFLHTHRSAVLALALVVPALQAPLHAQDSDPGTSYRYRVAGPVPPAMWLVLHRDFDLLDCTGDPNASAVDVVVQPGAEHARFHGLFPAARLVERGRPFHAIEAERAAAAGNDIDPGYYTTAEIVQEMDALVAAFPTLAMRVDLTTFPGAAQTHDGQSIWALKVSDSVTQDEDERAIVIAAQHHARELNSPHMVIGAMQRVLQGYATDPTLRAVVDDAEIWFVPCVNPDGVDHVWNVDNLWRKNRRPNGGTSFGVDLNRNYPTLWGGCGASTRTTSQTYRGPASGSEPETQTMRALVAAVRPEIYLDFHSSGQEVLYTYPPCGSVGASAGAMITRYQDDLRGPMTYAARVPSASGEAPEDHWNASGAMSFLVEIGTSFQPVFTVTAAEENRVWPGVRQLLTSWAPALRGHVRSLAGGQPVEAEITYTPSPFTLGEASLGRARDGRYGLWLPLGTWQVTWSAPGHEPETRTVTVQSYDQPQQEDVVLVPAFGPASLTVGGTPGVGRSVSLTYASVDDGGLPYWIALSGGTSPGLPLGSRTLPLNGDAFFFASAGQLPALSGNIGILSSSGQATATLTLPNLPGLVGLPLFAAGITFESGYPSDVKRWSQPVGLTIVP